jgi:hypothetical protein
MLEKHLPNLLILKSSYNLKLYYHLSLNAYWHTCILGQRRSFTEKGCDRKEMGLKHLSAYDGES